MKRALDQALLLRGTREFADLHAYEQFVAETVRRLNARCARDWDGYTFKLERLVDGGHTILGIGDYSGTFRATGKAMRARVVHVWELEGGKVRRFEQFCDTRRVLDAMK